ncbi:MAG: methyltransferase domain-containing protein [Myxococcota bacterium]
MSETRSGQAVQYGGELLRYDVVLERLPIELAHVFVPTEFDASTKAWADDVLARPHGVASMAALALARQVMSDYDANGMLGAHDMRVLGTDQWRRLLGDRSELTLLDVGAGEGQVTDELRPLCRDVVTTELSSSMARRLRRRGYRCHGIDVAEEALPDNERQRFDLIAALNVIDRTSRPYALIGALAKMLEEGGRLVCAAPLPLSPHVHVGPMTVRPDEILPKATESWEAGAAKLAGLFFPACGLRVTALTRAPYLCRGTRRAPLVALDDAIFVCKRAGSVVAG